ncbi:hypothetical protein [Aestuariivita sp.]|uniref:hypothetical protein n=1 Tax=Aestuariivita sp. TaxID=1872407 RepID=UPI00216C2A61|nr:hypothetical protein [Aestuariivita sp.]MCE8007427.1 hypothetical protein [Aestuariivita sp.]
MTNEIFLFGLIGVVLVALGVIAVSSSWSLRRRQRSDRDATSAQQADRDDQI